MSQEPQVDRAGVPHVESTAWGCTVQSRPKAIPRTQRPSAQPQPNGHPNAINAPSLFEGRYRSRELMTWSSNRTPAAERRCSRAGRSGEAGGGRDRFHVCAKRGAHACGARGNVRAGPAILMKRLFLLFHENVRNERCPIRISGQASCWGRAVVRRGCPRSSYGHHKTMPDHDNVRHSPFAPWARRDARESGI